MLSTRRLRAWYVSSILVLVYACMNVQMFKIELMREVTLQILSYSSMLSRGLDSKDLCPPVVISSDAVFYPSFLFCECHWFQCEKKCFVGDDKQ